MANQTSRPLQSRELAEALAGAPVPPHDLLAEQAVLSAVLLEPGALAKVRPLLEPESFYGPAHRLVYSACLALDARRDPLDVVTVAGELQPSGNLARVGGVPYLITLVDAVPSVANVETYAQTVRRHWRTREVISAARLLVAEGYGEVADREEWIREAASRFLPFTREGRKRGPRHAREVVAELFEQMRHAHETGETGVLAKTSFAQLDQLIDGVRPSEMMLVGGRPGMGKSAFVGNIAAHAAEAGLGVLLVNMEMRDTAVIRRMVASKARVHLGAMKSAQMTPTDWSLVTAAGASLSLAPMYIYAQPVGLSEIASAVTEVSAQLSAEGKRLGLVVVDYLQLARTEMRKGGTREQEIASISRALKQLALEHDAGVIALSQLSREVDKREDKRPQLPDLRESGSLEQDADMVLFLYREDYYRQLDESERDQLEGRCEVIVAKQRDGAVGMVPLLFDGARTCFRDAPARWVDAYSGGASGQ